MLLFLGKMVCSFSEQRNVLGDWSISMSWAMRREINPRWVWRKEGRKKQEKEKEEKERKDAIDGHERKRGNIINLIEEYSCLHRTRITQMVSGFSGCTCLILFPPFAFCSSFSLSLFPIKTLSGFGSLCVCVCVCLWLIEPMLFSNIISGPQNTNTNRHTHTLCLQRRCPSVCFIISAILARPNIRVLSKATQGEEI